MIEPGTRTQELLPLADVNCPHVSLNCHGSELAGTSRQVGRQEPVPSEVPGCDHG